MFRIKRRKVVFYGFTYHLCIFQRKPCVFIVFDFFITVMMITVFVVVAVFIMLMVVFCFHSLHDFLSFYRISQHLHHVYYFHILVFCLFQCIFHPFVRFTACIYEEITF